MEKSEGVVKRKRDQDGWPQCRPESKKKCPAKRKLSTNHTRGRKGEAEEGEGSTNEKPGEGTTTTHKPHPTNTHAKSKKMYRICPSKEAKSASSTVLAVLV